MVMQKKSIIVKFDGESEQVVGYTKKIVGLIKARYIVPIIDELNLEANPRSSKEGAVTDAIQETILTSKELFPFMSKGILLAASQYEWLERNRIKLTTNNLGIEGILDGGHNTLAIGLYILKKALDFHNETMPQKAKTWDEFKSLWVKNKKYIETYIESVQKDSSNSDLEFFIPVELLVPRDMDDPNVVLEFNNHLLDICAARNNNVQLQLSAKANQKGYFDMLQTLMKNEAPQIYSRVEWKTNDGGEIKVQNIVTLAWIPLGLIDKVHEDSDSDRFIEPVAPNKLYSGKGACLKQFEKLMSSPDVTIETDDNYKRALCNDQIESALEISVRIPALYDYIFSKFPSLYNKAGGSYRRISAVKSLNKNNSIKHTPFYKNSMATYKRDRSLDDPGTLSPEGFIMPLVYGLQALMEKRDVNGVTKIVWTQEPMKFLEDNLEQIVVDYSGILSLCDYDPQKVGKAQQSYKQALSSFKMAVAGML